MQLLIMILAAAAVLTTALIGEFGNFTARSTAVIAQGVAPNKKTIDEVNAAKAAIEKAKMQTSIQDQTLQDPAEACRDRAKQLAKDRGRAAFAWAETIRVAQTRRIKTAHGNPAFLVNVRADGERTYCAVIFENSTCKVDMLSCSEEQKRLQVARFGKLAAK